MDRFSLAADRMFYEIGHWREDQQLLTAAKACIERQRQVAAHYLGRQLRRLLSPSPSD